LEKKDTMTVFIIKCIQCKKEFDQGNSNTRICDVCKIVNHRTLMKIAREKRNIKQKEKIKLQTKFLKKTCPICQYEFKTIDDNKKYCSKRCLKRKLSFVTQIINKEKQIISLEERILINNKNCEEKIIEIESFTDKKNYELEKLRSECAEKLDFMRSVV